VSPPPLPFPSLLGHEVSNSYVCAPHHSVLGHHRPKEMGPRVCELKPPKNK
jgi:hypothetical protein